MKALRKFGGVTILMAIIITCLSLQPPEGKKAAYRAHYRGTLYFSEGRYQKALKLFQRAYVLEPDNFNFGLSLGMCYGKLLQTNEGVSILHAVNIQETDPDYQQKIILKHFFEGLIRVFAGHFHKAIPILRRSIELQEQLNEPELLSIMYNILGYATLLNQGKGAHGKELSPHYHVHRRDMLRAVTYFEQSLANDAANESARKNYTLLTDSLGIPPKPFNQEAAVVKAFNKGNTYSNLPGNINRVLEFAQYDEVVFLLDISGSMVMEKVVCKGASRFDVMKETVALILNQMALSTKIGIGTIGGDCGTTPRLWFSAGELSRKDLNTRLRFLVPDGTTPLVTILKESTVLFTGDTESDKAIFLVSDGANVCADHGQDICQWAASLSQKNIAINILTFLETNFSNTKAFTEYTCLADNTSGRILYIDNYRCSLERYEFNLLESFGFEVPELRRVECWGPAVKELWAIFPE